MFSPKNIFPSLGKDHFFQERELKLSVKYQKLLRLIIFILIKILNTPDTSNCHIKNTRNHCLLKTGKNCLPKTRKNHPPLKMLVVHNK